MVFAISKHIELKIEVSIRRFIDESKKIVDGEILNKITNTVVLLRPNQQTK